MNTGKLLLLWAAASVVLPIALTSQTQQAPAYTEYRPHSTAMWKASAVALIAANAADICSTRGKYELNGFMAHPDGRFDAGKAMQLKFGIAGATIGIEWLVSRLTGHRLDRTFAITNFAVAGALGGIAVHNYRIQVVKR